MKYYLEGALAVIVIGSYIAKCLKDKKSWLKVVKLLVIEAENHYKSGEGADKLRFVLVSARAHMPKALRFLLSDSVVTTIIEDIVEGFQPAFLGIDEVWDDNPTVKYGINKVYEQRKGSTEFYAEGSTDLKGDHRVSVGFKKTL